MPWGPTPPESAREKYVTITVQFGGFNFCQQYVPKDSPAAIAHDTLLEMLPPFQRSQVVRLGWFTCWGSRGCLYRIRPAPAYNIDLLAPDGVVVCWVCALPVARDPRTGLNDPLPLGDVMLGQYLHLSSNETGFLAKANIRDFPRGSDPHVDVPAKEMPPGAGAFDAYRFNPY